MTETGVAGSRGELKNKVSWKIRLLTNTFFVHLLAQIKIELKALPVRVFRRTHQLQYHL